ncbi:hypothetical protein O3G_MSEX008866 [Manduca sexta]|uniref:Uncharacterized protein n=1 Tax=Manduca sexta TaxID=7130 RepID=A0A921ZDG9_MANSE|nr:hypothetical protein O3G_MSEX008866 [Manduca sexta]
MLTVCLYTLFVLASFSIIDAAPVASRKRVLDKNNNVYNINIHHNNVEGNIEVVLPDSTDNDASDDGNHVTADETENNHPYGSSYYRDDRGIRGNRYGGSSHLSSGRSLLTPRCRPSSRRP